MWPVMNSHFLRAGLALLSLLVVVTPFSAQAKINISVRTTDLGLLPALVPYVFRSDREGNSVVVGGTIQLEAPEETVPHVRVSRFDGAQNLLWDATYDSPTTTEQATDATWDAAGNVYVTGYSTFGDIFNESVTLKFNSVGMPVWTNRFRPAGGQIARAVDQHRYERKCGGNLFHGHGSGAGETQQRWLARLDLSARKFGGAITSTV